MGFCFIAGLMVLFLWQENDLKKYKAWIQENTQNVDLDREKLTLIRKESKEKYFINIKDWKDLCICNQI